MKRDRVRLQRLYNTVDRVNKKNGTDSLKIAAQGYGKKMEVKKRAYFQEVHHEPERYNHDPVKKYFERVD